MGTTYTPEAVGSGLQTTTTINDNFTNIQTALDAALSRDGTSPNQMNADLDMNSNDLLNVNELDTQQLRIGGTTFVPSDTVVATEVESTVLTSGQLTHTFTNATNSATFYISGPNADNGRLAPQDDYSIDHVTKTITLTQSYPAGTRLTMVYLDGSDFEDPSSLTVTTSTGTQTLSTALDDRWISGINNVAALRAMTNAAPGNKIRTSGYTTDGDGGGNDYEIRLVTAAADDGGSVIKLDDGVHEAFATSQLEFFNVRQWGAVGDGTADDTAAINNVFVKAKTLRNVITSLNEVTIYFPPGQYRVTSPINATDMRFAGWKVVFDGASLLGETNGKAVIDAFFSRYGRWYDVIIYGDSVLTPSIGLQVGRVSGQASADMHTFYNLQMRGHFSTACVYNYASEGCAFYSPRLYNSYNSATSYCLIQDGHNFWQVPSDFQTVEPTSPQPASFNENVFTNGDFRKDVAGPAVWMSRTNRHRYKEQYVAVVDGPAWVVYFDSAQGHLDLHIDNHIETDPATGILFTGSATCNLEGFVFREHAGRPASQVFEADTGVTAVNINSADIFFSQFNTNPTNGIFAPGSVYNINGSISIPKNSDNLNQIGSFNGSILVGDHTSPAYSQGTSDIVSGSDNDRRYKGTVRFIGSSGATESGATIDDSDALKVSNGNLDSQGSNGVITNWNDFDDTFWRSRVTQATNGEIQFFAGGDGTTKNGRVALILDYDDVNFFRPLQRAGVQVVDTRKTGWTAPTGTATRTGFATSTATTADVAEALKALIDDLTSHGLIGS